MSDLCHCGSGDAYSECCGQYLNGADQYPSTPESVMRARYTAHVVGDIEFLKYSYAEEKREEINWEYLVKWIERSEFLGLEISNPQIGEDEAELELIAHYREQGKQRDLLHEISQFRKQDGRWVFYDAKAPTITTVRRESPKVGRNDPCPCGSGKKFKKCHGAVV